MKLKDDVDIATLSLYHFKEMTEEYYDNNYLDEYDPMRNMIGWAYELGHGRRGQKYYLICGAGDKTFYVYATKPDGDGAMCNTGDIIIDLISADLVTTS